MIFVTILNLYIVRLLINTLGVSDYGISDVITGVVTLLVTFSSVLSSATQRFYSSVVEHNLAVRINKLRKIFSVSLLIHVAFSFLFLLIGETLGLWLVKNFLIIPENRWDVAISIYHFSLLSFIIAFMHTPYSAALIAREDLGVYALINILESVLKLAAAIMMGYVSYDKLLYYGITTVLISCIIFIIYRVIAIKRCPECKFVFVRDYNSYTQILTFSGWVLFSAIAGVALNQILTIMINGFFGPQVSAAKAIAFQFNFALTSVTAVVLMAVRPRLIQAYALKSFEYVEFLFLASNKFLSYILILLVLPLYIDMAFLLDVWLGKVQSDTIVFARLVIIYSCVLILSNPIGIIMHATGNLKLYHIVVESIMLSSLPIIYFYYSTGGRPEVAFIIITIVSLVAHCARIYCLKLAYRSWNLQNYLYKFILPSFFIFVLTFFILNFVKQFLVEGTLRFGLIVTVNFILITIFVYLFGFDNKEREIILSLYRNLFHKKIQK